MFKRKIHSDYDNEPSKVHHFNSEFIKKYIKNKRVLDVGCWTGQLEKLIVNRVKSITGIDPDADAIAFAKGNITKGKFMVGTVDKLSLIKERFDAVTFFDVIEHIPPKTEGYSLRQINKVLGMNGMLFLSTPNNHLLSILLDPAFFLIGHRHYSIKELVNILEKNGFIIEEHCFVGGTIFLLNHLLELIKKRIFKTHLKPPAPSNSLIDIGFDKGGYAEIYLIARKIRSV